MFQINAVHKVGRDEGAANSAVHHRFGLGEWHISEWRESRGKEVKNK